MRRGTVLAEGVGEVLTNIEPPCPFCYVVLAKLPVSVSTAKVYQSLKWDQVEHHPDTKGMLAAMAKGDVPAMGRLLGNVLETVFVTQIYHVPHGKKERRTTDGRHKI